jgi:hypothetical protein
MLLLLSLSLLLLEIQACDPIYIAVIIDTVVVVARVAVFCHTLVAVIYVGAVDVHGSGVVIAVDVHVVDAVDVVADVHVVVVVVVIVVVGKSSVNTKLDVKRIRAENLAGNTQRE